MFQDFLSILSIVYSCMMKSTNVYIYSVFTSKIDQRNFFNSKVIKSKNFKSLGYSLSAGLDMDNNNYPDLLVGAYESDIVILYKTRPIIDISIKIDGDLKNINSTKKGCAADPNNRNHTW